MKKSLYVKFVAVVAVLALLCQMPVGAVSIGEITTEPMEPIVPKTSLGLPLADIPEVLTAEQTVQAQNVARLRDEEETQNSAVFRNADGTNTLYLFSENIWYEDANGEKHDYNTKLTQGAQAGTFMSANAGGNLVLPQSVSADTPISYTENGYTVTMYPVNEKIGTGAEVMGGEGESRIAVAMTEEETARIQAINEAAAQASGKTINAATLDAEANTVEYFRANADATLISSTLLHGVKNDLLMASDNNIRNYSFIVDTDGLTPIQSGETSIALVDDEGQLQGYINVEEIIDANGNKSNENEITSLAKADGTYLITMTVDESFLDSATYPTSAAVICAMINLDASHINDTDLGTYEPNANYSTTARLYVGNLAGEVYRSYFQLVFNEYKMSPYAVLSAHMKIYEGSPYTASYSVDPKIPAYQWNLSTINWNSSANQATPYDPFNSGGKNVSPPTDFSVTTNNTWYTIYMTEFVQACLRNYVSEALPETVNELRGFLLKSSSESTQILRYFSSTNASSNKPYVVLNYIENYLGGARPYVPSAAGYHQNCLGFAANIDAAIVPPLSAVLETMYQNVYNTLTSDPYNLQVGRLNTNTSGVSSTQWRVALRYAEFNATTLANGFHVWVETDTGLWAHKNTDYASELIYSTDDPADDVIEWLNYSVPLSDGTIMKVYMINLTYFYIDAS